MKAVCKTNSTISVLLHERNLMKHLTARLEDGYCSITVANHELITVIRFVAQSCTHPWKDFTNKLHLVFHACEIFLSGIVCAARATEPIRPLIYACMTVQLQPAGHQWRTVKLVAVLNNGSDASSVACIDKARSSSSERMHALLLLRPRVKRRRPSPCRWLQLSIEQMD